MNSSRAEKPVTDPTDEKTLVNLILKFMGYTTAHGIGRLTESKTIFWKLFWTAVCIGAFGMFITQGVGLFKLYLSRPVSTTVTIKSEKQLPFPAVTICNLNVLRKDAVPSEWRSILKEELQYDIGDVAENEDGPGSESRRRRFARSSDSSQAPNDGAEQQNSYDRDIGYDVDYSEEGKQDIYEDYPRAESVDKETRIREELIATLGTYEVVELDKMGHSFLDLVANCTWKGLDCKTGNLRKLWIQSWNYRYGNCFTFNSGIDQNNNKVRVLKSSKPGPSQGLILELDIQQELYVGPLTIEAGVRVVLHDQGQMPFPVEEGFSVAPKMATSVGLSKLQIVRLDRFDNESCWSDNELPKQNIYRRFRNITRYSEQACLSSCLGSSQWDTCQCSEGAYPSNGKPCDIFNFTIAQCLQDVQFYYKNDELGCLGECRQPCKEELIQKTISSSQWPSKAYEAYLESRSGTQIDSGNLLLLNIFYNEFNYEKIEEKYSYGGIKLIADIGGQLGLWIGISVLTCCEVLELFMKILSHIINKCKKGSEGQANAVQPSS